MRHGITLSTNLLLAVKAVNGKTTHFQPAMAGIKISPKPVTTEKKSKHSVNELGNLVHAGMEEEVTV